MKKNMLASRVCRILFMAASHQVHRPKFGDALRREEALRAWTEGRNGLVSRARSGLPAQRVGNMVGKLLVGEPACCLACVAGGQKRGPGDELRFATPEARVPLAPARIGMIHSCRS